MKRILSILFLVATSPLLACPKALPTNNESFCSSFKAVATCYCTSSGLPSNLCQDIKVLHQRVIAIFGSLQKACEHQHYTPTQDCIDNWNCYLYGGIDSRGRLCSATQRACE